MFGFSEAILPHDRAVEVFRYLFSLIKYMIFCVCFSVSYLEPREIALVSRQSRLKEQFGFNCDCRLCFESNTIAVAPSWTLEAYAEKQGNFEEAGRNALDGDKRHRMVKGNGGVTRAGVADADTRRRQEGGREHEGAMAGGVATIEEDEDDLDTKGEKCVGDLL